MASELNDRISAFTSTGSVNLYSGGCVGTASDKALAAAMGGHNYNFLSQTREKYFPNLRTSEHFIDAQNQATGHWWARRRHLSLPPTGESAAECLASDEKFGASEKLREQRRLQRATAQITHAGNFRGYQEMIGNSSRRAKSEIPSGRSWEGLLLQMRPPVVGGQWRSEERLPLVDGAVTKGNNFYSGICKLTRYDNFFKIPKLGKNVPSVTYNTVTNRVRSFVYQP